MTFRALTCSFRYTLDRLQLRGCVNGKVLPMVLGRVRWLSALRGSEDEQVVIKRTRFLPGYDKIQELENASEDVQKVFSLNFASQKEHNQALLAEVMDRFKDKEGDTGSTGVMIAALTSRIQYLTDHLKKHRKDKDCLRSLMRLIARRRKYLLTLKRREPNKYHFLLEELHLRPPVVRKYLQKGQTGTKKSKPKMKKKRKIKNIYSSV